MQNNDRCVLFGLFLVLLGTGLGGCGGECTDMYVPDQVRVAFEPAIADAGHWQIEIAGAIETGCALNLPVTSEDDGRAACEAAQVLITLNDDVWEGITLFEAAPDSFTLRLYRDEALVLETVATPSYETSEPNGEGCGESEIGHTTVEIPAF